MTPTIPVAGPETTVVMKLKFGSPQDVEDAFSILAEQRGKLDLREMRSFAAREGVSRELDGLLRRVETPHR